MLLSDRSEGPNTGDRGHGSICTIFVTVLRFIRVSTHVRDIALVPLLLNGIGYRLQAANLPPFTDNSRNRHISSSLYWTFRVGVYTFALHLR